MLWAEGRPPARLASEPTSRAIWAVPAAEWSQLVEGTSVIA
jgi:hypothetical protein